MKELSLQSVSPGKEREHEESGNMLVHMQKRKLRSYRMVNCLQIFGMSFEKSRENMLHVKGRSLAAD